MRAALSDAAVSDQQDEAGMAPGDDNSAETLRALHEKIETAFVPPEDEAPPLAFVSPFGSAMARQSALFGDLNARLERLEEGAEITHLRETMREMCAVISGLAEEAERGANERDDKIASLAHALQGQLQADRDRLDAMELRVVNSEAGVASSFEEVRTAMRQLEERMRVGDAHNEDLAYNMRTLRGELSTLNETAAALGKLEERMEAQDARHDDLARRAGDLKDELTSVSDAAASTMRHLEDRLEASDTRHDGLAHDMIRVKGEVLSEAAAAMRIHQSQIEQTEQAIGELRDRNARSAERIEALTDSLGSMGRKLDIGTERLASLGGNLGVLGRKLETEANGAQLLAERLGIVEKWIAKAHEREKARAELHARLADSLSLPPES